MAGAVDNTLTLDEVAARLQVTPRWLRGFVRRKRIGVLRSGRITRFDDRALAELDQAMRVTYAPARSSGRPAVSAYDDALNLTTVVSRKKPRRT